MSEIVAYRPEKKGNVIIPAKIVIQTRGDDEVEIEVKAGFRFLVSKSQIKKAPQWIIDEWNRKDA